MVINTQVDAVDLDVLRGERETPTEHLSAILDPARAADDVHRVRWEVLAWLLANEQLEIRVITPTTGGGIFHPKTAVFRDKEGEVITTIGSNNESLGALKRNYEIFSVHSSITDSRRHWQSHINSFDELWTGERSQWEVYKLPEAIEAKILEVAPPDKQRLMDDAAEHLPEYLSTPTDPTLTPLLTAGRRIGGTHLAEDISPLTPWISPLTPWVHQRIVADTLTAMYPRGFLLCDEVGLGKTIEAGLTVARLIHTGEVDSCLILTPANLMTQWQEELLEKFNLQTHRFERGPQMTAFAAFVDGRGSTVEVPDDVADPIWWFTEQRRTAGLQSVIIASWHLMRRGENQELIIHPDAARDGSMPHRGRSSEAGIWDLVIVDEAHKARRTNFNNLTAAATENANKLPARDQPGDLPADGHADGDPLRGAVRPALCRGAPRGMGRPRGVHRVLRAPGRHPAGPRRCGCRHQERPDRRMVRRPRHAGAARSHPGGGPDDDRVRAPADVCDGTCVRPVAAGSGLPRGGGGAGGHPQDA
jgi:hypothetical protein